MAKEENKSGGLLSKVARFVRNPTVNWSDLDQISQDGEESQYSKQALKEMLERKRQNDFVRKREFENLRKLRQAQLAQSAKPSAASGVVPSGPVPAGTSFMQTMQSGEPGERADTIKKIDEIEAQMAQQWWRGKQAADAATMPLQLPEGGNVLPSAFRSPPPGSIPPVLSDALPSDLRLPGGAQPPLVSGTGIPGLPSMRGDTDFSPGFAPTEVSSPVSASMVPPSFTRYEHDAVLEEPAIVFANGDAAGAQASLKGLIARRAQDIPSQLPLWLALLDLYRAAGWQDQFDDAGMDFASRFGRSAPQWFAMPQQAGQLHDTSSDTVAAVGFRWQAPVQLSESSLKALQTSKARSQGPWTMDWSALEEVEAGVLTALLAAVQQWSDEKGELIFAGHERLLSVMGKHCPSGQKNVVQDWWHLRLALQRLMHLQDDFELTALDYCVTYEVSPPSWVDPVSSFLVDGQRAELDRVAAFQGPDSLPLDVLWRERAPRFALQGVIEGDALPWLAEVQSKARLGEAVAIDCSRLVRMDFAAAGSVLNWAAEMQSLGHVLQFSQLHQLVAVFFNVVGIQEHAQVIPRRD